MISRILDRARAELFNLTFFKNSFHKGFNDGVHTVMKIVQEEAAKYENFSDNDLTVVSALPSLYPLQPFEEEAIQRVAVSRKDSGCAWDVIYNKICELEKQYANLEGWENVNRCLQLENLLQYFKEQLKTPYQKGEHT